MAESRSFMGERLLDRMMTVMDKVRDEWDGEARQLAQEFFKSSSGVGQSHRTGTGELHFQSESPSGGGSKQLQQQAEWPGTGSGRLQEQIKWSGTGSAKLQEQIHQQETPNSQQITGAGDLHGQTDHFFGTGNRKLQELEPKNRSSALDRTQPQLNGCEGLQKMMQECALEKEINTESSIKNNSHLQVPVSSFKGVKPEVPGSNGSIAKNEITLPGQSKSGTKYSNVGMWMPVSVTCDEGNTPVANGNDFVCPPTTGYNKTSVPTNQSSNTRQQKFSTSNQNGVDPSHEPKPTTSTQQNSTTGRQGSGWTNMAVTGVIIHSHESDKKFRVSFDVGQFSPSEITVHNQDNKLIVQAKHVETTRGKNILREFNRQVDIPDQVDPRTLKSMLRKDGILEVEAPVSTELCAGREGQRTPRSRSRSEEPSSKDSSIFSELPDLSVLPIDNLCTAFSKKSTEPIHGNSTFIPIQLEENKCRKKLKMIVEIGPFFNPEDILITTIGRKLNITAIHEEGSNFRRNRKQYNKEIQLSDHVDPSTITAGVLKDGRILIQAYGTVSVPPEGSI